MALENVLVYQIATGDNTYPHSGPFTITEAGQVTIDDSDGTGDSIFGDFTHTGGADVPDQDVTASSVAGINVGDTIDLRYKYTFTGSDGSSGTVYFIATNSTSNYGPLLVSDTPLDPSVTYTFGTFNTDGAVAYDDLVPCLTHGTIVETDAGPVSVENLRIGVNVLTEDAGPKPIRWIASRKLSALDLIANPKLLPVLIRKNALGPNTPQADLIVSPQHRVLLRSRIVDRMFENSEVLVPAIKLVGTPGITRVKEFSEVNYYHFLLDDHQLITSNGAITESLYTGAQSLAAVGAKAREEIAELFPEVADADFMPKLVRTVPAKGRKTDNMIARHAANNVPLQSSKTSHLAEICPAA